MEIVNTEILGNTEDYQQYASKDITLITTATITATFGNPEDYIEYFIYDLNGDLLASNYFDNEYNPINPDPVTGVFTSFEINPEQDVRSNGYDRGSVDISYNFLKKLFKSDIQNTFWIKEVSGDRTELRVVRQDLSNLELQQTFLEYDAQASVKAYYPDFYLNFGDNKILIGVNVLYALQDQEGSLLIKLYEPLPDDLGVKDTFWIVDKLGESTTYRVTIEVPAESTVEQNTLRGPNYNIGLAEKINQTTPLYNYTSLFSTSEKSSLQQIKSLMDEKGITINVDYTNFENFVHFSSITERIYNFAYKVGLIENYNNDIAALGSVASNNAGVVSGSVTVLQDKIDNIIKKFDGYEYYLYFTSGSQAWPKSTSTQPYTLYPVTSSQALNWLGSPDIEPTPTIQSMLYSASVYDSANKDYLVNSIPEYLKEDSANQPYELFLDMVGQHFDNIWIYLKDVTERFDAENNLFKGISKNLVGDALKSLGINLYTNTNVSDNLYYSMLGINPDGSLLPPTGSEQIKYYITSSQATSPAEDITLEYYKRIYHNLPYLLKTRGTTRGLRALISCFGIPDTILRVNEFGGSDKSYSTPDLIQNRHALAFSTQVRNPIFMPWAGQNLYYLSASNSNIVPDTVEFRFKTLGILPVAELSQSIFELNYSNQTKFGVNLQYSTSSAIPSSSLQYNGELRLFLSGSSGYAKTSPITLPFFNEEWWSLMIKRETGSFAGSNNSTSNRYWVYVKGATYNEEGNSEITYEASQSIYVDGATSSSYNSSWNTFSTGSNLFRAVLGGANNGGVMSPNGNTGKFAGYFQEFRYWASPLSEAAFDEHVQNSLSYKGNTTTGSLLDLTFRIPLGSNLNIPYQDATGVQQNLKDYDLYELGITTINGSDVFNSYHPTVTGSFRVPFSTTPLRSIGSFVSSSGVISYGTFAEIPVFVPTTVADLIATPSTGPSQKVNNKVNIPDELFLSESLLSPFVSLQKFNPDISKNSPDIEVGFSPSDTLDLDITSQLGYFNIDDYIGKPSDAYQDTYSDLSTLRTTYYQKYLHSYNLWDFVRLIKYFDNSLFKMIKDYVPARANLSTGIIVKPTILERPKYPRHEPTAERENNYTGSIDMLTISGSNPEAVNLNTTYSQSLVTPLGTVNRLQNDLREPFTGEFSGSKITVTNGLFPQVGISSITGLWTSSIGTGNAIFTTYSLDPLLNNVSGCKRSTRFLAVDYSSNINIPVNNGLITGALALYESRSLDPLYQGLNSPYWPFAEMQDYYYQLYSRQNPRYQGSKTVSALYNTYSIGDSSYGRTAAIDKVKEKYAYLVDIYTASAVFPKRVDAQIKYLIDNDENTLNLTKANPNIFDVQNIYKSGETAQIALFDYNPANPETQLLTNNKDLTIYEGGFRYLPILHNLSGSATSQSFTLTVPIAITVTAGGGGSPTALNPANFSINFSSSYSACNPASNNRNVTVYMSASMNSGISPYTYDVTVTYTAAAYLNGDVIYNTTFSDVILTGTKVAEFPNIYSQYTVDSCAHVVTTYSNITAVAGISPGGSGSTSTYYTTYVTSSQPCVFFNTSSQQLVFNSAIAEYYEGHGLTFNSISDPAWISSGVDKVILPFILNTGDRVSFYDSASALGWDERFEYTVNNISVTGSDSGSRLLATLDRPINLASFVTNSVDETTNANFKGCRYVVFKHVPDETNLILRYNPSKPVTQDGLIYPQYLSPAVKSNAGNVLQSLKANNLI